MLNHLYPPNATGGSEKAVATLAEAMMKAGHSVAVITLHDRPEETVEELHGVRVYRVPMDNLYWAFDRDNRRSALSKLRWHIRDAHNRTAARRVGRILDKELPDVVHSHVLCGFSAAIWKQVKRRNIRLVHTLHDYYLVCARSSMFQDGHSCAKPCSGCRMRTAIAGRQTRLVDHVVGVSHHVLDTHRRFHRFQTNFGSVIHNVQPPEEKEGKPSAQARCHRPLQHEIIFGFIGRISEEKGIKVLLDATARLANPNWRLHIAGGGTAQYVGALKSAYSDPRIVWEGIAERAKFYSQVDVIIIPSIWQEPLPYVMVEAIAAGKRIIVARSGGLCEMIPLGKSVASYTPENPEELAGIMDEMLANPGEQVDCGFIDADSMDGFSERTIIKAHEAIYRAPRPA